MELTKEQLKQILPKNPYLDHWFDALSKLLPDYEINTANRMAAFLAQCSHESGGFTALKENLNYKPATLRKIFGKYFPTDELANEYCNRPNKQEAIANRVYANRMGNGPESSGDGYKFRGRGPIQLTGKDNYTAFAKDVKRPDVLTNPDIVATELAFESALWFFNKNGLFAIADKGVSDAVIGQITRRVNGGTHGLDDRIKKTKQYAAWG